LKLNRSFTYDKLKLQLKQNWSLSNCYN